MKRAAQAKEFFGALQCGHCSHAYRKGQQQELRRAL
jgi:hypothetical protein